MHRWSVLIIVQRDATQSSLFIILYKYNVPVNNTTHFYLAGCSTFLHLPAPIWQLSYLLPPVVSAILVFFLQLPLSFQSSSINPFSPTSPLIPSAQVALGLPRFLLPDGLHFLTFFGNLPSSILWTCPHHFSWLVLISSKIDLILYTIKIVYCQGDMFRPLLGHLQALWENRSKSYPTMHWNIVSSWICFSRGPEDDLIKVETCRPDSILTYSLHGAESFLRS